MPRPREHDRAKVMAELCAQISTGKLVATVAKRLGVTRGQIHQWTSEDTDEGRAFRDAYARAREEQAHAIAEEALKIADRPAGTTEEVARHRLQVDTRKWLASKIAPRSYGERVTQEHVGEGGGPVAHVHRVLKWGDLEIPL